MSIGYTCQTETTTMYNPMTSFPRSSLPVNSRSFHTTIYLSTLVPSRHRSTCQLLLLQDKNLPVNSCSFHTTICLSTLAPSRQHTTCQLLLIPDNDLPNNSCSFHTTIYLSCEQSSKPTPKRLKFVPADRNAKHCTYSGREGVKSPTCP